ncbi:MAG: CBS domain-containing protein [Actinomycetota bacterium]
MKAKDIMTKNVIAVKRDATVEEIVTLLLEHKISGVPVVDDKYEVIGVVTEEDLLYKKKLPIPVTFIYQYGRYINHKKLVEEIRKMTGTKAQDIMCTNIICTSEDTPVRDIVSLMITKGVKRVFVTRDGKLVGLVSKADILKGIIIKGREAIHAG